MKKRLMVAAALVVVVAIFTSCRNPTGNDPPDDPQDAFVIFDNVQGICAATVYNDYRKRIQDIIAVIPAKGVSEKIECKSGASVTFYFSYTIKLLGIDSFELDFIPEPSKSQVVARIDPSVTTKIVIPSLAETLSSPEQLLSNNSYLFIRNNSFSSFILYRGTSEVSPDNRSFSAVVNAGERAQYTINSGAASNYQLLANANYTSFTGYVTDFKAGHVYSFNFNGNISIVSDVEIKLKNVATPSPALVKFTNLEQFPVTIYDDESRQYIFAEVGVGGTKTVQAVPAPTGRVFYPVYQLLYQVGIPNFVIPYIGHEIHATVETGKTTLISIPKLVSIEINSAYIVLKNESDVSLLLKEGSENKDPMSGGSSVINSGQNATYEISPGPSTAYTLLRNANASMPVDFPSDLIEFRRGIIYVLTYNGTNIILDEKSVLQTIPPAAPVIIQAEVLSKDSARISWDSVYGATLYRIYRAVDSETDSLVGTTKALSYIDTGIPTGHIYFYKVSALSGKEGEKSNARTVPLLLPQLSITRQSKDEIDLSWLPINGAGSYKVFYNTSNSFETAVQYNPEQVITSTDCAVTGLTPDTVYYFWVQAFYNDNENSSEPSPVFESRTLLPGPENLIVKTVSESSVELTWDTRSGADGYIIEVYNTASQFLRKVDNIRDTQYTVISLNSNTRYSFAVKAVNSAGIEGEPSEQITALTLLSTPRPEIILQSSRSIKLSWQPVAGANSYKVYYSTNNAFETAVQYNPEQVIANTDCIVRDLIMDTMYYFWVQAFYNNDENYSMPSPAAEGKTIRSVITIIFDFTNPIDPVLEGMPEYIKQGSKDSYTITVLTDGNGWDNRYNWYLRGVEEKDFVGASFTIDWQLPVGPYVLTVVAARNGVPYSASAHFKVLND